MKKDKIYKYRAVYVEWIDSTMRKKVWWSSQELIEDTKKVYDTFQTIGYLVNENKLEYIFAGSIHFEDDDAVSFAQIFSIPKGCVTKLKNITINSFPRQHIDKKEKELKRVIVEMSRKTKVK